MVVGSSNAKQDLRKLFKERMAQSAAQSSNAALETLEQRIVGLLTPHPGVWAVYKAHQDEIPFPKDLQIEGVSFVYPRVKGPILEFLLGPDFIEGPYGILEPDPRTAVEVDLTSIVGLFIPALAYDHLGTRLGRGKGYYDRALAHYEGLKVGVAWDNQISTDPLPCEEHDLHVDLVMTDRRRLDIEIASTGQQKGQSWK